MLRKFLWGSTYCPVAWKTVCLPRNEGGLGLRELNTWNKALQAKTLWNIHAKTDSLWIKWVHTEFLEGQDIWEFPIPKRDAPFLSNILRIRDRLIVDCQGCTLSAKNLLSSWFSGRGTADAYEYFRPKGEKKFWHKAIWKPFIPPKFSVTLWMAIQGRLKTFDRLKHADIPRDCTLCGKAAETHEHLFFQCEKTRAVWASICAWLKCKFHLPSIKRTIRHFHADKAGSGVIRKAKWIALGAAVQYIWQGRNLSYIEKKLFDAPHIVKAIKTDVYRVLYNLFPAEVVFSHMDMNTC